jgi:hypothetical protein
MVMKKASGYDSPLRQDAKKSFWTLPISGRRRRRLAVCFLEKCSSLIVRVKHQLGTPRGRYEEHNSKFPSVVKPRFNRTSRRKLNFRRLMLPSFATLLTRAPDKLLVGV